MESIIATSFKNLDKEKQTKKIQELKQEILKRIFQITEENKYNPNCIDGRDNDSARPSIPGGKFGALGVVLSTLDKKLDWDYNRAQISQIIQDYFKGNFWWHTDTHADNHGHGCECNGCGHVFRLINEGNKRYNMSLKSIEHLKSIISTTDQKHIDTLDWNHEERNVLIVSSPWYWITANYNDVQDFVYNSSYAENIYSELASIISTQIEINESSLQGALLEMNSTHLNQTAWDLAKWKDMFNISSITTDDNWNISNVDIEYIDTI